MSRLTPFYFPYLPFCLFTCSIVRRSCLTRTKTGKTAPSPAVGALCREHAFRRPHYRIASRGCCVKERYYRDKSLSLIEALLFSIRGIRDCRLREFFLRLLPAPATLTKESREVERRDHQEDRKQLEAQSVKRGLQMPLEVSWRYHVDKYVYAKL